MKYYYEGGTKKITLKKGCSEWVNLDCPDIFTEGGQRIMHNGGMNGWYGFPIGNEELLKQLRLFIIASDKAFCKKYPEIATFRGENGLVKNMDKEISFIK